VAIVSNKNSDTIHQMTRHSAQGLEMGVSVVVGLAIGYWLDEMYDTTPWMTLFWLCCGTAAGVRSLMRLAKKLEREAEEEEEAAKSDDDSAS
jgi:ATP synthase protein I